MGEALVSYEMRGGVALMTMDDGKANALSPKMLDELTAGLDRAEAEAKALVLAGREGRFCGGFDLKTMMSGMDNAMKLVRHGGEVLLRLYTLPMPVVVACTGHAMAGGALLLLVADTRIGAEGAFRIGLNEVSISMPLPILAQELARDRLDPRQLTAATMQARIYDPAGAVECGYLDRSVSASQVVEEALKEATRLGELPKPAHTYTKTKLREATVRHIRDTMDEEMKQLTPPTA